MFGMYKMTTIKYVDGDATSPIGSGNKIVCHVCNSIGGWGRGFVLSLSKKWKEPELEYRKWFKDSEPKLGQVQFVRVESDIAVANMIGQEGVGFKDGKPPIRYEAIKECLGAVARIAKKNNASIHAPRFGAGLAGGKWEIIEELINDNLCKNGIEVTIYDYL